MRFQVKIALVLALAFLQGCTRGDDAFAPAPAAPTAPAPGAPIGNTPRSGVADGRPVKGLPPAQNVVERARQLPTHEGGVELDAIRPDGLGRVSFDVNPFAAEARYAFSSEGAAFTVFLAVRSHSNGDAAKAF